MVVVGLATETFAHRAQAIGASGTDPARSSEAHRWPLRNHEVRLDHHTGEVVSRLALRLLHKSLMAQPMQVVRWLVEPTPRFLLALGCASTTLPSVALAEVMDKEAIPWSPARLLACALVVGICAGLMGLGRRARGAWRWPAVLLAAAIAVAWAIAGAFDDFLSRDVGPAMRLELGRLATAYAVVLLLEHAAPIVVVVALGMRTRSREGRRGDGEVPVPAHGGTDAKLGLGVRPSRSFWNSCLVTPRND